MIITVAKVFMLVVMAAMLLYCMVLGVGLAFETDWALAYTAGRWTVERGIMGCIVGAVMAMLGLWLVAGRR